MSICKVLDLLWNQLDNMKVWYKFFFVRVNTRAANWMNTVSNVSLMGETSYIHIFLSCLIKSERTRYLCVVIYIQDFVKDKPFILTSRHGHKPGIFLTIWLNQLICFFACTFYNPRFKNSRVSFFEIVRFEHLKKPFHV